MEEVEFKREEEGSQKLFVKVLWEKLGSNCWRKANISAENTSFILVCLVLGREQKSKKMKTNHLQRTQPLKNENVDKMSNLTVAQPRSRSLCGPTSKQWQSNCFQKTKYLGVCSKCERRQKVNSFVFFTFQRLDDASSMIDAEQCWKR